MSESVRAYMHGLNRAAAVAMGEDPDAICSQCGSVEPRDIVDAVDLAGLRRAVPVVVKVRRAGVERVVPIDALTPEERAAVQSVIVSIEVL